MTRDIEFTKKQAKIPVKYTTIESPHKIIPNVKNSDSSAPNTTGCGWAANNINPDFSGSRDNDFFFTADRVAGQ